MATEADTPPQALAELLLAFGAAPGQYPVRLGEPRLLYRELDTVAAWAIGRIPPAVQAQAVPLAQAAVLFVLRACFASGNTHYQVLGLPAGTIPPEQLRSRYRALIRLTHPDMAVQGLPPDAAGIVNRAHEVLSDPDLRARYDEQLAERAAERAAAGAPRGRVRPEVARIEHRVGWGERLASLAARYPGQVRAMTIVSVIGVVTVGLLAWAARDVDRGRMLVVAERPDSEEARPARSEATAQPRPAPRVPTPAIEAGPSRPAPVLSAAPAAGPREDPRPQPEARLAEAAVTAQRMAALAPQPVPPRADLRQADPVPYGVRDAARTVAPAEPITQARTNPPAAAPAPVPAPPPAQAPAPAPAPVLVPEPARQLAAAAMAQPSPAKPVAAAGPAAPPAQAQAPSPAPTSDSGAAAREAWRAQSEQITTAAATAAPATGGGRIWTVDTVSSLDYFNDIVNALERPTKARQTHRYLRDMRVKGTLLQPALDLMSGGSTLQIERLDVVDVERPGVLNLRGTLVLQASTRAASDTRLVRYRLNAEFWGTREGTVLGVLDMREAD